MHADEFREHMSWKGDLVVARYTDAKYSAMLDVELEDYRLVNNFFAYHCITASGSVKL